MAWTYGGMAKDIALSIDTDIVYRTCYRAGRGGPFKRLLHRRTVRRRVPVCPNHAVELWDNGGLVNTASMLRPEGENVRVAAGHGHIAGSTLVDGPIARLICWRLGLPRPRGAVPFGSECCAPAFSLCFSEDSLPRVLAGLVSAAQVP